MNDIDGKSSDFKAVCTDKALTTSPNDVASSVFHSLIANLY